LFFAAEIFRFQRVASPIHASERVPRGTMFFDHERRDLQMMRLRRLFLLPLHRDRQVEATLSRHPITRKCNNSGENTSSVRNSNRYRNSHCEHYAAFLREGPSQRPNKKLRESRRLLLNRSHPEREEEEQRQRDRADAMNPKRAPRGHPGIHQHGKNWHDSFRPQEPCHAGHQR